MSGKRRSSKDRRSNRASRRRPSIVTIDSLIGTGEDEEEAVQQMYSDQGDVSSEEEIFENIKLQKEIIQNIRLQPWRIRRKLQVLSLAKIYVEKHEGRLSRSHGYQEKGAQAVRRLKRELVNLISLLIPWEMRIKRIESYFGSVVASYFVFIRWMIWINLWLAALPLCFIIVPEVLVGDPRGSTERKTVPEDERDTAADLKTIWDAEGILRYSVLFYGYYGNAESIGQGYRLPLAYLLTGVATYAFSFGVILKRMAENSRMSRRTGKDEQFTFAWKAFTSWDFMIGNTETANNKVAAITTTMKESIIEEKEKAKEGNKYVLVTLRVIANLTVLILLGLSTWAIQICVERSRDFDTRKRKDAYVASAWEESEIQVVMTLIAMIFPNIFELISLMEKYHPRTNLRWLLARIFVLNLLNMYTLFIALYYKQEDLREEIEIQLQNATVDIVMENVTYLCPVITTIIPTDVTAFPINVTDFVTSVARADTSSISDLVSGTPNAASDVMCTKLVVRNVTQGVDSDLCWETMIGQELFKLTILDLVFLVVQILIVDVLRGLCVRFANVICCWDLETKFPEYPEFKTAENILQLVSNQGQIWLGTFFCPGIAAINLVKLLILFYLRCWTVLVCNIPEERIFRASKSNNFYYACLLVMLFLCTLPVLFMVVTIKPSPNCGPFSNLAYMVSIFTETLAKDFSDEVNNVIYYATSAAVIIPVFLLLVLGIYYLISTRKSLIDSNKDLKMQLGYERTEGRKKVYAMAGVSAKAQDDDDPRTKSTTRGPGVAPKPAERRKSTFTGAVSNIISAHRMKSLMSPPAENRGQRSRPSFQHGTRTPIAIVHGKQSLQGKHREYKRAPFRKEDEEIPYGESNSDDQVTPEQSGSDSSDRPMDPPRNVTTRYNKRATDGGIVSRRLQELLERDRNERNTEHTKGREVVTRGKKPARNAKQKSREGHRAERNGRPGQRMVVIEDEYDDDNNDDSRSNDVDEDDIENDDPVENRRHKSTKKATTKVIGNGGSSKRQDKQSETIVKQVAQKSKKTKVTKQYLTVYDSDSEDSESEEDEEVIETVAAAPKTRSNTVVVQIENKVRGRTSPRSGLDEDHGELLSLSDDNSPEDEDDDIEHQETDDTLLSSPTSASHVIPEIFITDYSDKAPDVAAVTVDTSKQQTTRKTAAKVKPAIAKRIKKPSKSRVAPIGAANEPVKLADSTVVAIDTNAGQVRALNPAIIPIVTVDQPSPSTSTTDPLTNIPANDRTEESNDVIITTKKESNTKPEVGQPPDDILPDYDQEDEGGIDEDANPGGWPVTRGKADHAKFLKALSLIQKNRSKQVKRPPQK